LTGATGYVGGRLLEALERRDDLEIRCLARRPQNLRSRVSDRIEVVAGDLTKPESLPPALAGIDVAFYLAHALGSRDGFAAEEQRAAANFARAAQEAGVKKIVYLGGLGRGESLSPHLASRQEVGRLLRESGVPTIEFRASIIIGSGSLSFEMIRALVRKLPVMITPRWVGSMAQPIGIEDVIDYLVESIDFELHESRIFEIGGPDRASYKQIMQEFGRQRGLHRWMIPVPVLTPRLSSLWLGLVTPVYARVGRKLVDSLQNDTVVEDDSALREFSVRPRGLRSAIERALLHEDHDLATTRWSDALSMRDTIPTWGGVTFGSRIVDSRHRTARCSRESAFAVIRGIGGERGWYYGNLLWRIRGFLDLLVGGVGLRRGRRDPDNLVVGDALDFWRVESIEPNQLLRLQAEMKLPGRAWLQFEVEQLEPGKSRITQTAIFDPIGLAGLAYWYVLYPMHTLIFAGMLRRIAHIAEGRRPRQSR